VGDGISLSKSAQRSSTVKTWTQEQSIVSHEAQWIQPWLTLQSKVDFIRLVHSTCTIMSNAHLHNVKSSPEKSKLIQYVNWMDSVMIAIEYNYIQAGHRKYFNS